MNLNQWFDSTNLQQWFDSLGSILPNIPDAVWFGVFILPIVLALFSRSTIIFLSSVLTACIALFIVLKPSSTAPIVAIGSYIGGLLVAIYGIQTKRRKASVDSELMSLRSELNEIGIAEERISLGELKRDGRRSQHEAEP